MNLSLESMQDPRVSICVCIKPFSLIRGFWEPLKPQRIWETSLIANEISYYKRLFPFTCNLDKVQKLTLKHFKLVVSLKSLGSILRKAGQPFFYLKLQKNAVLHFIILHLKILPKILTFKIWSSYAFAFRIWQRTDGAFLCIWYVPR